MIDEGPQKNQGATDATLRLMSNLVGKQGISPEEYKEKSFRLGIGLKAFCESVFLLEHANLIQYEAGVNKYYRK